MYFLDLVNSGATPALEKMLAFTQARQRMLAENVANADTPGYQAKHLDAEAFQRSLSQAMAARQKSGSADLELGGSSQFHQDESGRLVVTPTVEPAENVLFHDQTNMRIERQMAMMAENAMMHTTVTELLRGRFEGLLKAIRGRSA